MAENYLGKIVFLEAKDPKNAYPASGEYVIIKQTPSTLYGMKLIGGYESHELRGFSLVGAKAYNVVSVDEDDKLLTELTNELEAFSKTPEHGGKRQWVDSVYTNAGTNVRLLREALKEKNAGKGFVANGALLMPYVPQAHVEIRVSGIAEEVKKAIAELHSKLNAE